MIILVSLILLSFAQNIWRGDEYTVLLIPAGSFKMGCKNENTDCDRDERPIHTVHINKAFYLMESEVTQELYEKVMGTNPSYFNGPKLPVDRVSWYDAVNFANALSVLEGREQCYQITSVGKNDEQQYTVSWNDQNCKGWRLPTEAEWEYAANGKQGYLYAGSNQVTDVSWYWDNSQKESHDVCTKQRNSYRLCDMSGNVYEWVYDRYGNYSSDTELNPTGSVDGTARVIRGGGYIQFAYSDRVSNRNRHTPTDTYYYIGFRLARTQ